MEKQVVEIGDGTAKFIAALIVAAADPRPGMLPAQGVASRFKELISHKGENTDVTTGKKTFIMSDAEYIVNLAKDVGLITGPVDNPTQTTP